MNCCSSSAMSAVFRHCIVLLIILLSLLVSSAAIYHDYCIIGAGPSGLQLGYFFKQSHRDYVIFEKSNISGSFFVDYPRHRTLISINKRHTGKTNKEFNLRHDWNSLISDDESLLLKHYSKEMFPHADDLVRYFNDFQKKLGINVQFNTNIGNIKNIKNETLKGGTLFTMDDQHGTAYSCRTLVMSTGISTPTVPKVPGIEYAEGYETISINPDDYEGQTVLILGRGNSAFEVANSIYGATNLIHMVGRSRVRLAWATHYVGDLRAVNNALLDTYQLKSLDGVLEATLDEVKIVQRDDRFHLEFSDEVEMEDQYLLDNFAMREPYDRVIRCLGFHFDRSIFDNSTFVPLSRGRLKKFPAIKHNYESTMVAGMFFTGALSHSLDFRKSAGGFIHGFRYTARALHHLLEWRYNQVPWPSVTLPTTQLMNTILKRLNEASGIYQMFSVLGEVVILKNNGLEFTYLEEFPIHLIHNLKEFAGHEAESIIVINLQYGANFSGPGKDIFRIDRATGEPSEAHNSNFLHPCLYYYDTLPTEVRMNQKIFGEILPRPTSMHHIVEDFLTTWDAPVSHLLPLRRFLENVVDRDLRLFFQDGCLKLAMTHMNIPVGCEEEFVPGHGLEGTQDLLLQARIAGML